MGSSLASLLVLAAVAIFLILRLRSVLGTREGFEKPRASAPAGESSVNARRGFEVIDGGPDHDITENVEDGSRAATSLAAMKRIEPDFSVTEFLSGARGAYEMILMAFEGDNLDSVSTFLSEDVYEAFQSVVDARQDKGLKVDAQFLGLREIQIIDADLDRSDNEAEIKIRFVAELISVVRNSDGDIVEGDEKVAKRQKDIWTFGRVMGSDDPNWQLVATGA